MVETGTATGWQLQEDSAAAYERYLVPAIFRWWAQRLVDLAAPRAGERALDVACGTGVVARQLAPRVGASGKVVGLDVSAGMLAVAQAASAYVHPPISWRQGSAMVLPFDDATYDLVTCQQALQFFPDPRQALREMRRVLSPQGRVALSVWRPLRQNRAYALFADVIARHAGRDVGEMMRAPFPDLDTDDLRELAEDAGFSRVRLRIGIGSVRYASVEECLRQEAASSPLAHVLRDMDDKRREGLLADLRAVLREYVDDEGLILPIEAVEALGRP